MKVCDIYEGDEVGYFVVVVYDVFGGEDVSEMVVCAVTDYGV